MDSVITGLYHAHSGLRYLVLLAGVVALVVAAAGWLRATEYGRPARISVAAFAGLMDLQILLGIVLVLTGIYYPALMGHIVMMLLGAAALHGLSVYAKRATAVRRAHRLALIGVLLALLAILGGVMAIGRSPLESRAFSAPVAAEAE